MNKAKNKAVPKRYDIDEGSSSDFVLKEPYVAYLRSPLAKLGAIRQGLKPAALSDLITVTGATQIDVAKWLDITEPTLRKHIQSTKGLNAGISEHVIQA